MYDCRWNSMIKQNKKIWISFGLIFGVLVLVFFVFWSNYKNTTSNVMPEYSGSDYKLKQIVLLSRHNIRSPFSGNNSTLSKLTNHKWFDWSSDKGDLSLRGGVLETIMGQYFRKYLSFKKLISENWIPEKNQVRFYANSLQRTIATTNYFVSGLLPAYDATIESHCTLGTMDPVFNPQLTFTNDNFYDKSIKEILEMFGKKNLSEILDDLSENFRILEKVLDFESSKYAKDNNISEFKKNDINIIFQNNKEPSMSGTLKIACEAADALVLQYYEEKDDKKAAFGEVLSLDDWKKIAQIVDTYQKILFSAPSVAINVANPLLKELKNELNQNDRIVSYLCGHDSNLGSVLSALKTESYSLHDSITQTVPLGSKLVFEKWINNNDNKDYVKVFLVYPSVSQLRRCDMMDLEHPPCKCEIKFIGIEQNKDGFYSLEDILNRFNESISLYNELKESKLAA